MKTTYEREKCDTSCVVMKWSNSEVWLRHLNMPIISVKENKNNIDGTLVITLTMIIMRIITHYDHFVHQNIFFDFQNKWIFIWTTL